MDIGILESTGNQLIPVGIPVANWYQLDPVYQFPYWKQTVDQ